MTVQQVEAIVGSPNSYSTLPFDKTLLQWVGDRGVGYMPLAVSFTPDKKMDKIETVTIL